jgi:hypothetical protein
LIFATLEVGEASHQSGWLGLQRHHWNANYSMFPFLPD